MATHGLVGAGAGLLIGLVLLGDVEGEHTRLVLTWTGLGLAAGVASGVVTWLVE